MSNVVSLKASTMEKHEPHPLCDIFPLMEGADFEQFVEDIRTNKLNEPIVLYEDKILDGRNRERACHQAGVRAHYTNFNGSYKDARAFVISQNIMRRHLTTKQKRDLIEMLIEKEPDKSDRQIAATTKTSHHTVASVRRKKAGNQPNPTGQVAHSDSEKRGKDTRTGKDGRKRPASKSDVSTSDKVIAVLKAHPKGLTTDEVRAELPEVHNQTVNSTLNSLVKKGYAVDTGQKREPRSGGGRASIIYRYSEQPDKTQAAKLKDEALDRHKAALIKVLNTKPFEERVLILCDITEAVKVNPSMIMREYDRRERKRGNHGVSIKL